MKNHSALKVTALIGLVVVVDMLSACGGAAPATPPTQTSIQMSWTYDYSIAGFYAAEKNGHFAEQNLKVVFHEGGFGPAGYIEPINEVVSGTTDFGLSSAATLIQARAEGKPVVGIMTALQRSPFALISLKKSNITKPSDLVGKTVAVSAGGAMDIYLSFLKAQGIDAASVHTIERTDFGVDPLLSGKVDVLAGWIINEGVMVEEAGQTPSYILPSDYGIESYDFVLFTTDSMVKEHPDKVQKLVKALVAGLNDVVANSTQAVDYTLVYNPKLDRGQQQRRMDAMLALIRPSGSKVGVMDPKIWQLTYDVLTEQGSLSKPVDVKTAYTLDFVTSPLATH